MSENQIKDYSLFEARKPRYRKKVSLIDSVVEGREGGREGGR